MLLLKGSLPLEIAVEGEVSDSSVLGNGRTCIFEGQICGIECGAGGTNVVALRVAEDKGLRCNVEDGRLAEREAVGRRTDAGATNDGGDVGISELLERGECFIDVCLCGKDFGITPESEIDCC